jgi:AmpD protein
MAIETRLDSSGWLLAGPKISLKPSPNFNERPTPHDISLLVIHNISLPPGQFGTPYICDLFLNQLDLEADPWFSCLDGLKVSAHFLIDRTGHITQFVSCDARAWHAGVSSFEGREQCNDFSIGIELEGTDTVPYTDAQYASLHTLTQILTQHYRIRAVRGHEHIAPNRKTDPGASFDWVRYHNATNQPELNWPEAG